MTAITRAVMGNYISTLHDPKYRCAADCRKIELGYLCPVVGQGCYENCGDGYYVGNEKCDDGNTVSGDGCYKDCRTIEAGFQCESGDGTAVRKDVCSAKCGDGLKVGTEACDDNNLIFMDG